MDIRQLEYFVAVAEEGNFTRAAQRVHISQSGVSAQIKQLELDLGAPLIDRSGRIATLTEAGAAALEHARAALSAAGAVRQAVDEVNGLIRGRLVVGMVAGCTVTALFDALAALHRAHPGIDITLIEDNSDRLVERVRTGSADLALIGAAGAAPTGLDSLSIVSEPLVAAVPPGHCLAARHRASLAEIGAFPIVTMPEGTGVRAVFDLACARLGVQPAIALQASSPGAVADLAARGLGVAILSQSMAEHHLDRLTVVAIDDVDIPAVLAVVWATTMSPALRALVGHVARAFAVGPAAARQ